ncbi:MAG TPA: extracellular solute-binding protein [Vicinamibacteria bacterium]|nr:extracellular solute-binding protein [Vicinamibacteria bacterium]
MTAATERPCLFVAFLSALLLSTSCGEDVPEVVVYTSVDQVFSQPVLERFQKESGIRVRAVYDTEETKSTGVVNRLIAEADNPQADVFWSGDVFRCLVLKQRGILTSHEAPSAIPESFRDPDGTWTGFSGRARVLAYRRDEADEPPALSLRDFTTGERAGELALANPLFGTTTVHVAALFVALGDEEARALFDGLKAAGARMVSSNSESLRLAISGEVPYALTDTDDAFVALEDGEPLKLRFPDQDGVGTLFMPNAVARMRGGPNPEGAQKLIDFLLTSEIETMLRDSAGQIPVLPGGAPPEGFGLAEVRFMNVDYEEVARKIEEIQPYLKNWAGL